MAEKVCVFVYFSVAAVVCLTGIVYLGELLQMVLWKWFSVLTEDRAIFLIDTICCSSLSV